MLAKEDCDALRIVKTETQCEAEIGQPKSKEDSKEGWVDGEDDVGKDSDDEESEGSSGGINNLNTSTPTWKGETYAQRRERNIAENKKLLEELKAKYPVCDTKNKGCVLYSGGMTTHSG